MKAKRVVIFPALLLMAISVNAQQTPDISSLKKGRITLSRAGSKEKPREWTLVQTQPTRLEPVGSQERKSRNERDLPDADPGTGTSGVGGTRLVSGEKRTYYMFYSAMSSQGDDPWLQLRARVVPRGDGFLKDMGVMKWEDVKQMPELPLQRLTQGEVTVTIKNGVRTFGPAEFLVKASPDHVYAVQIQDDRMDLRMLFRIDAIDPNGDCHISWKIIPTRTVR